MDHEILTLSVLNGTAALLGLYFLVVAWRAHRRHRSRHMLVLVVAVGFLTMGQLVEGFTLQVLGWGLGVAHVAEALVSLGGFVALVYSLHA